VPQVHNASTIESKPMGRVQNVNVALGAHEKLTTQGSIQRSVQIAVKSHLCDVPIRKASSFVNKFNRCLKREENDFRRTMSRPKLSRYLKTIHCGHRNIEYGQFRLMRLNGFEGRFTIFGLGDNFVGWLQQISQHLQDFSIVVSDNDSMMTVILHPSSTTRSCGKSPFLIKKFRWMDRFLK
jgi:hypothetical protein